jgi:hypothetical protein
MSSTPSATRYDGLLQQPCLFYFFRRVRYGVSSRTLSRSLYTPQLPTDIDTFEMHIAGTDYPTYIQFGQSQCTFAHPGLLLGVRC